jgi:ubiquinone/menaquinone biosynthesis C-methylase UbiE
MEFETQEHWNKSHLKHPKDRQPSDYAKDKEKYFPHGSVVCDLGGGDGTDSIYFLEKGYQVYLYDVADLALKRAEKRAELKGLENHLITKAINLENDAIPTEDNFFDVLYARLSLHYFYKDRVIEIFKDIYRVLKEKGTSYIVVKSPNDKNEMKWLESNSEKLGGGIYNENGLIKTRLTKDQYRAMLVNAGIADFKINDYIEKFGEQKIFVKSKAEELLYTEITIQK